MTEFTFEESAWELEIDSIPRGKSMSASRLMVLLEEENEDTAQSALERLEQRGIPLDISDLPPVPYEGEMGARLKLEAELARKGTLLTALPQDDPLRLCLADIEAVSAPQITDDPGQAANAFLPRVAEQSKAMAGKGVLLADLIQEGSLGLWQGITCYKTGDLREHCDRYIRNALARAIFLQARENGVGQKLRTDLQKLTAADKALLTRLGRNPTIEELALELQIPVDEADSLQEMLTSARQMKKTKPAEDPAEQEQSADNTAYFQSRQRVAELLSVLPAEDVKLLTLRFGLEDGKPRTPEETGKILGIDPSEVVTREEKALQLLRGQ